MNFLDFQQEFNKLKLQYPLTTNHSLQSENSDYGDFLMRCKNAYFSFDNADSNDIIYIFDSYKVNNSVDGDYVVEADRCYECIDVYKAYNSTYLNYCGRIYDSHYCWDCYDSNNLFGCVHLQFKQYCIYNKQYSPEEYKLKIKELLKRTPQTNLNQMMELGKHYPVTVSNISSSQNSDYGNHIHYSKNLYLCFDAAHSEDCAYLYDAHYNKNSFDLTQSFHCEFSYECVSCDKLNNCYFMNDCGHIFDSAFCERCSNSDHLFGCFCLDKKQYCILNKQFTKEDYEKEIKELMESYR